MTEKGECPKCGGVMEWKRVDLNPLNFLVFAKNPLIHAWKCETCNHEIGRTDTTWVKKVRAPQGNKNTKSLQNPLSENQETKQEQKVSEKVKSPQKNKCQSCGKEIEDSDWVCPHCGRTEWGNITFFSIISIALVATGFLFCDSGVWRWIWVILGGVLFMISLTEIIKSLTWSDKGSTSQPGKK